MYIWLFVLVFDDLPRVHDQEPRRETIPDRVTGLTGHAFTMAFSIVYCAYVIRSEIASPHPGPPTILHDTLM